uniref:ShKT domain-containing protein n=1 Tax=Romanomermis culicivorax TaxID=13658 RepID=A0A915HJB8_ROMCU
GRISKGLRDIRYKKCLPPPTDRLQDCVCQISAYCIDHFKMNKDNGEPKIIEITSCLSAFEGHSSSGFDGDLRTFTASITNNANLLFSTEKLSAYLKTMITAKYLSDSLRSAGILLYLILISTCLMNHSIRAEDDEYFDNAGYLIRKLYPRIRMYNTRFEYGGSKGSPENLAPIKRAGCILNAGLSHGCDAMEFLSARQQHSKFGDFSGPGDPVKGTSWVLLEQNAKCGTVTCPWPYQWCAISKVTDDNALASTVNCVELSPQCQAKMKLSQNVEFDSPLPAAGYADGQQPRPPPTKGTPAPIGAAFPFARQDAKGPCRDFLPSCSEMVTNDMCESRKTYMRAMCPKACNRC